MTVERQEWDSEFWGLNVGRATHPDDDCTGYDTVWLLVDGDQPEVAQEAERAGYFLTDVRMEYERDTWKLWKGGIHSHKPEEVDALAALAREEHHITRFYADPHLPRERCDDLYEGWIRNSCAGYADEVLVPNAVLGYCTLHFQEEEAQIGLIATSRESRGQGYGAALIWASIHAAYERELPRITVVTQGRNIPANRLFQRCGFRVFQIGLWFHKWP